jgi:hypothetical protein
VRSMEDRGELRDLEYAKARLIVARQKMNRLIEHAYDKLIS